MSVCHLDAKVNARKSTWGLDYSSPMGLYYASQMKAWTPKVLLAMWSTESLYCVFVSLLFLFTPVNAHNYRHTDTLRQMHSYTHKVKQSKSKQGKIFGYASNHANKVSAIMLKRCLWGFLAPSYRPRYFTGLYVVRGFEWISLWISQSF